MRYYQSSVVRSKSFFFLESSIIKVPLDLRLQP